MFYFYQPTNRDIHERQMLVIPIKRLHEIIQAEDECVVSSSTDFSKILNDDDIMSIVHTALLLRKKLAEHRGYTGFDVLKELAQSVVPEYLYLFLCVLMKGQEAVDDFFNKKTSGDTHSGSYDNDHDEFETDDSDDENDLEDEEDSNTTEHVNESNYFDSVPNRNTLRNFRK